MEHFVQELVYILMEELNFSNCHLSPHVLISEVHTSLLLVDIAAAKSVEHDAKVDREQDKCDN